MSNSPGLLLRLAELGWLGVSLPAEYGGGGLTPEQNTVLESEMRRLRCRPPQINLGIWMLGPVVLEFGSEEQKRELLPPMARGEIRWCQGFSEPNAGSDLASLKTSAVDAGDHFVVNGTKIWTSYGDKSDWMYMLVRTNPDVPKQQGISLLVVDMTSPGIEARPIDLISGKSSFCQVFFDNVKVPASCLLGEEGDGWVVSQRGLNLDRVGAWRYLISVKRDEDIVNWLKSGDERAAPLKDDAAVRDKVAELWIEGQVCRLMTMRSMTIEQRGQAFNYEGAAEKVWAPEHGVRTTEAIGQMLGPHAQLLNGSPDNVQDGLYAHNLLSAFQSTVNHGSVQVMRDQIARKGLGLPKPRK